jgi:mannose-1-phosphate guanylyltransferase
LNKPFLLHVLYYLKKHGIDDVILALYYLPEQVKGCFGSGRDFGVKLSYVVEDSPLGTAGAVKNVEQHLGEPFFVLNGDIFADSDLTAMMAFHREKGAKVTIALTPVADPTSYGLVETDEHGRVLRFLEKPSWEQVTTNMINAGIYILEPEVIEYIPTQTHFMFERELFPVLLEQGEPLYGYPAYGYWIDIGTPERYLQLNYDLLLGRARAFYHQVPGRSSVHPSAQIEEPVLLGGGCDIGPDALLRGPTVMGLHCRVGEGAMVERSVLWDGVQVGRKATLRGCIVADNCVIADERYIGDGSVLSDKEV